MVIKDKLYSFSRYSYGNHIRGEFTAYFTNSGTKIVSAIEWNYIFYDSFRENRVVDEFTFKTTDKPIKPKQTKRFTKRSDYYQPDNIKACVSIKRVEYADGTVWINPKVKVD